MKNLKKSIFVLIIVLIILGGWHYNKKGTFYPRTNQDLLRQIITNDQIIGTWKSGDNDFGYVKVVFGTDGKFLLSEKLFNIDFERIGPDDYEPEKPTENSYSGYWDLINKTEDQVYLSLKFNEDFKDPSITDEQIQLLRKNGQEFMGENEIYLKPEYYKDDPTLRFRYNGFLIHKSE